MHLRLEQPKEAIDDIDKALKYNPSSIQAVVEKAEALYNMGEFEKALVQFHRALRARKDPEIRKGMYKCSDAILGTLGDIGKTCDKELVQKVVKQKEDQNSTDKISSKKKKSRKKKQKNVRVNEHQRNLLGRMNEDGSQLKNEV